MNEHWIEDLEQTRKVSKRIKLVAKSIGTCGYTPLTAQHLAGILVHLSMDSKQRQTEVMNLFARILDGRNK